MFLQDSMIEALLGCRLWHKQSLIKPKMKCSVQRKVNYQGTIRKYFVKVKWWLYCFKWWWRSSLIFLKRTGQLLKQYFVIWQLRMRGDTSQTLSTRFNSNNYFRQCWDDLRGGSGFDIEIMLVQPLTHSETGFMICFNLFLSRRCLTLRLDRDLQYSEVLLVSEESCAANSLNKLSFSVVLTSRHHNKRMEE